jgi:hypothetical protein
MHKPLTVGIIPMIAVNRIEERNLGLIAKGDPV